MTFSHRTICISTKDTFTFIGRNFSSGESDEFFVCWRKFRPTNSFDWQKSRPKDLKLGWCLGSFMIFMTWHHPVNLLKSRDLVCVLWADLYFTDYLFSAFYRLFCIIANLWNIDLQFSGFITDVHMDNHAKFREVSKPKSCIKKNLIFGILICKLQTRSDMSKNYDFVPPYGYEQVLKIS